MKCLFCSRLAKFQIPNNPKIVFCDKICHFEYVNGKREREEEEEGGFFDNNDYATEFLLRVDPLDLINSELVNKQFRSLIFTIYFMKQYVELHEIPDEFMWWIYTKTRPKDGITREIEFIVNAKYEGFFKDRLKTPDRYFFEAVMVNRFDLVEVIVKYKTKIGLSTIEQCLIQACRTFNLALFNILLPKIDLKDRADTLLSDLSKYDSEDQVRTVNIMFLSIYKYCSDDMLNRCVFYFRDIPQILRIIFKRIPIKDEHLAEIIWEIPKEYQIENLEKILNAGEQPKSIPRTLNAVVSTNFGSKNEVYRYLKNKFNLE